LKECIVRSAMYSIYLHLIRGSKDLDLTLVFNKNFSEIFGLAVGP